MPSMTPTRLCSARRHRLGRDVELRLRQLVLGRLTGSISGGLDDRDGELVLADVLRDPRRLDRLVAAAAAAAARPGLAQEDDPVGREFLERLAKVERPHLRQLGGQKHQPARGWRERRSKNPWRLTGAAPASRRRTAHPSGACARGAPTRDRQRSERPGHAQPVQPSTFPLRTIVSRRPPNVQLQYGCRAMSPQTPSRRRPARARRWRFVLPHGRCCHPRWTPP